MDVFAYLASTPIITLVVCGFSLWFIKRFVKHNKKSPPNLRPLPVVAGGLPIVGNLLQLKEKKPHKIFLKWVETYGPVYSIRTGYNTIVVINSIDVAKEAMVTKFDSISTKKLSTAVKILADDKSMVATSDYDEFHKIAKRQLLTHLLGPIAQKRNRIDRDIVVENTLNKVQASLKKSPLEPINFRKIFELELFSLGMKHALGLDVDSIYVDELGITMSKEDMFQCIVIDPMAGSIEVDWRDFFPYLKWIPNRSLEKKVEQMYIRKTAVIKALIKKTKTQQSASKEGVPCYLEYLETEEKSTLTEKQIHMLMWEVLIATADTTLVATEWAMYEIARDSKRQQRLYEEISRVCGSNRITEEHLHQLPYLYAIFQETIRVYSPFPVTPLRYVHEDIELGGYFVPEGTEIAINIYGCNMDKSIWKNPEEWKPERFMEEESDTMELHRSLAFGGGKRVCAGSLQAMAISRMTIGTLIQQFEWSLSEGQVRDVDTFGLTSRKLHPMLAHVKPRC